MGSRCDTWTRIKNSVRFKTSIKRCDYVPGMPHARVVNERKVIFRNRKLKGDIWIKFTFESCKNSQKALVVTLGSSQRLARRLLWRRVQRTNIYSFGPVGNNRKQWGIRGPKFSPYIIFIRIHCPITSFFLGQWRRLPSVTRCRRNTSRIYFNNNNKFFDLTDFVLSVLDRPPFRWRAVTVQHVPSTTRWPAAHKSQTTVEGGLIVSLSSASRRGILNRQDDVMNVNLRSHTSFTLPTSSCTIMLCREIDFHSQFSHFFQG